RPEEVKHEVEDIIGLDCSQAPLISAKNGVNIGAVLEKIVEVIPPPSGVEEAPLRALIFDSLYDNYKGVITHVRVMEGSVRTGQEILMLHTKKRFTVTELG